MKRTSTLLALLLSPALFAQNAPTMRDCRDFITTIAVGTGYRRDRQRFEQRTAELYYLNQINSATASIVGTVAWDRLLFKLSADYGWLIDGQLPLKGLGAPFQPTTTFSSLNMGSGYSVDLLPAIACRIKFWTFCPGSLSFIPLLGFIYSHFNVSPRGQTSATPTGLNGLTTLSFTRPIQQDWYGPVAEGRIAFAWREQWRIDAYYQYQHPHFRQTLEQSVSNYFTTAAGALTTVNTSTLRISSRSNSTRTHLGGADISYSSCNLWRLGLHFEGSATWTTTGTNVVHTKTNNFLPANNFTGTSANENLSIHWVRYNVNLYGSYWF